MSRTVAFLAGVWLVVAGGSALAKMDVKVHFDKAFNFKPLRTWGWNPKGAGDVKMARTPTDDPEKLRQRAEPLIMDAVATGMRSRGLQEATTNPDIVVTYYLLMTTSMSAQTMGQFVPTVPEWGIPPFLPATQSLEMYNQGSLVLDMSAKDDIVWRGMAQAKLSPDADDRKRESLLREAVTNLLKKFPPKS